jgi:hypothetical protein
VPRCVGKTKLLLAASVLPKRSRTTGARSRKRCHQQRPASMPRAAWGRWQPHNKAFGSAEFASILSGLAHINHRGTSLTVSLDRRLPTKWANDRVCPKVLLGMSIASGRKDVSAVRILNARDLLAQVARLGFCQFTANENLIEQVIQCLARRQFAATSTSLHIKAISNARPNTLSAKYGTASFPFHTDFAFCALPPRYILLTNTTEATFQRPTLVAPIPRLQSRFRSLMQASMWKLRRVQKHYLVNGSFVQNAEVIWRWDCDFLKPANREAEVAYRLVPEAMNGLAVPIEWAGQTAVLIDNWCCAHARGEPRADTPSELTRVLTRYEFWRYARMVR